MNGPDVSFLVACHNAVDFLEQAVATALGQRDVTVEVIVVDDHSTDASHALALDLAKRFAQVRVFRTPRNMGPAGARNVALAAARGEWVAILDSDDLLHPVRSRTLIAEARLQGADMIADDMILFDNLHIAAPRLFLAGRRAKSASWIDLADYFDETRMYGRKPNLGFLKPMIRRAFLLENGIGYDEELRIAEDDAFVLALLRKGARYRLLPQPHYFYRKHDRSISHRLTIDWAERMLAASRRFEAAFASDGALRKAFAPRARAMERAAAFEYLVGHLKSRDLTGAVGTALRRPGALPLLRKPLLAATARLIRRFRPARTRPAAAPDRIAFVSRQRLMGATNGSSAYLLAVAHAARDAGFDPDLLQPSPVVFGRIPFYALGKDLEVFRSIRVRGAFRMGRWILAASPYIWAAAALGAISAIARKCGLDYPLFVDRKFPQAISAPWNRDDALYIAAAAGERYRIAIADYAFQAQALAYFTTPATRTATVMHDLFHARVGQFEEGNDTVAQLSPEEEIDLLGMSQAVLAIQADEAEFVRENVAGSTVLLAPMPALIVPHPSRGNSDELLFVGSNTAPNVLGLRWFIEQVWPHVLAARPQSRLIVAGSVARAFSRRHAGIRFLGIVADLAPLYDRSGLVISPLRQGSGLKVKLIEALARGKASVVTTTTLQGVENIVSHAVALADTPSDFAAQILRLQGDPQARTALAACALETAARYFGPAQSMREFTAWLNHEPDNDKAAYDRAVGALEYP